MGITVKEPANRDVIVITDNKCTRVIPVDRIVHVEACGPYSLVYDKDGTEIVWSKHLKMVEHLLDSTRFLRIHKGHVVNMNEVVSYKRGRGGFVILSNGVEIAVAHRRKGEFLSRFLGADDTTRHVH